MLRRLGIPCEVRPSQLDEAAGAGESAERYVTRLASEKALAVLRASDELVLAADTAVVVDGDILGKPADSAQSLAMLRLLSGRKHQVLTGFALATRGPDSRQPALCHVDLTRTEVVFSSLSENELRWYAATQEGHDKAGAYAIQGFASLFVERIEGSYANVVGLPIADIYQMACRLGLEHLFLRSQSAPEPAAT